MLIIDRVDAFQDNYIWVIHHENNAHCVVIDPGDHAPVMEYLEKHKLQLETILITHKHADHIGGAKWLKNQTGCQIIGPANDGISLLEAHLSEGDTDVLPQSAIGYKVIDVPGHTHGHIAYLIDDNLFCGDTLFVAGCGRVFEGTMQQMYDSLCKLANLPENTAVYCAHEYTLASLEFAVTVEPDNQDLLNYQSQAKQRRIANQATVPSTIALEKAINPFLRCHEQAIIKSASSREGHQLSDPVTVFGSIRQWKNVF